MASKAEALVYTVNIPDQKYIDDLIALPFLTPDGYVIASPKATAIAVGIGLYKKGIKPDATALPILGDPDDPWATPSVRGEWFGKTALAELQYPLDQDQFTRKSGGWFGISWLFGTKTLYTWYAHYEYAPALNTGVPTGADAVVKVPMPARRWIDGGELADGPSQSSGEGGTGNLAGWTSRRASRHAQGLGYTFEHTTAQLTHAHVESGAPATASAWERFYVRVVRFPDSPSRLWHVRNTINNGGPALLLSPAGSLALYDTDGLTTYTLVGAVATLLVNTWYKIDLLYTYGSPPAVKVFVNGVKGLDISGSPPLANMGTGQCLQSTLGGGSIASAANNFIWHLDDWMAADQPTGDYTRGASADFIRGSCVALVGATGFASNHNAAAWAGDWRLSRIRPPNAAATTSMLASTTSASRLSVTTDAATEVDGQANQLGIIALSVGLFSSKGGSGASGSLGWKLPGGATDVALGTQTGAFTWTNRLYRPSGLIAPLTPLAGLELTYDKGPNTDATKVQGLLAVVEILGTFGDEDVYPPITGSTDAPVPADSIPNHIGIHNAPYPHTPWAQQLAPPQAPVVIKTGTYVGNGTVFDLAFRSPVAFLWIRGTNGCTLWVSSMISAHSRGQQGPSPEHVIQVLIDPTFVQGQGVETNMDLPSAPDNLEQALAESNQLAYGFAKNLASYEPWTHYLEDPDYYWKRMLGWQAGGADIPVAGLYAVPPSPWLSTQQQQTLVRLAGPSTDSNVAGQTYTYVAFCDPGMRFCDAGGLAADRVAYDVVSPLDGEQFTPEAVLLLHEAATQLATASVFFKGLGSGPTAISLFGGAEVANGLAMSNGTLTYKPGLANANAVQASYIAFRRNDGSGDPGVSKVLWLASYVGDGGGTRTINFAPSGVRPAWALVVGHNGVVFMRDPSHLTTSSTQWPNTANASTGITAGGIDSVTLGVAVNAAGVTYDVFVLPGSATAGNGGWSPPGEFVPVDPAGPQGPPYIPPLPPLEPPGPPTDPPFPPGPPIDPFGPQCVSPSTQLINQALSRIGIGKQIGDILTENTMEATVARLHYITDVDTVLRDFAWPFATHYATLVIVAGPSPAASPDWLYSYRRPTDCVFERRLCVAREAGVDPTPPPFQLGSDADGGLIYTNQADAVLEYTSRSVCAAGDGDPLFKDALAWRHALSLAPPLTRMTDVAAACQAKYQAALAFAFAVLRPGNPGRPTLPAAIDADPAAAAANAAVVNRGLLRIGAQTITNLTTDQSRGAVAVRDVFEAELQSVLRDFAWPFATRYVDPLVLVAGSPTTKANPDWTYSYRLPLDCVMARRLVSPAGQGRRWDPTPPQFRTGTDAIGGLLFTDLEDAVLEYTARLDGTVLIADHVFQEALAWRLAAVLAPSLAQADPEAVEQFGRGPDDPRKAKVPTPTAAQLRQRVAEGAWQQYNITLNVARASAMKEQQQAPNGPAPWIVARGDQWNITRKP